MNPPRNGRVVSGLLALLALVRCGGDSPGDVRGGPPPGSAVACVPGELTRPDGSCQPAGLPPDMPCPPGELSLEDGSCQGAGVPPQACAAGSFVPDGRGGCAPILPEQACPFGQMAVPGDKACREVAPCGEGPWNAAIPAEPTTEYVDQGYSGIDSDGSPEKPWTTVLSGVRAAAPGAIVAVAEGRYTEDVLIVDKPVRLWGRCPARTVVIGLGSQRGAITLSRQGASGSEVRGLAVTGPRVGIDVREARSVAIEQVWVHELGQVGVSLDDRAAVTVRGALLEQNAFLGMFVSGSDATVDSTVVRASRPGPRGDFGWGISVQVRPNTDTRGNLALTTSLVEQNQDVGVVVLGSDATIVATVVRETQLRDGGDGGYGVSVQRDAATSQRGKLSLAASLVERNHEFGVAVLDSDATIVDTVVRETQPNRARALGRGVYVAANATTGERGRLSLSTSLVEQNHDAGVAVLGSEATIMATVVRETQPNGDELGWGVGVRPSPVTDEAGKLSLTASLIERNHQIGVSVEGSDATIVATTVRATEPDGAGEFGQGIDVQPNPATGEGGKLSLTASLVEANHDVGVFVLGSEATLEAVVVRATQPNRAGEHGRGIDLQADPQTGERGKLSLTASLVEENHDVGVFLAGSEATIAASVVRATKRAPAGLAFGDGILVIDELGQSSAAITATECTGNERAGLFFQNSTGHLSRVRSTGNRFGLVRAGDAKPELGDDDVFDDNQQNRVEGGDLPVPSTVPTHP